MRERERERDGWCASPWQLLHFVSRTFIFALRERRCLVEHVTSLVYLHPRNTLLGNASIVRESDLPS